MVTRRALLLGGSGLLTLLVAEFLLRAFVPLRDVGTSFTVWDAELGKRLKPAFHALRRTPEFTMTLTTNARGWRGAEVSSTAPGAIVCLGDSFTLGYGVSDGEEFPCLVGRALQRPAVNMGIGGNGQARWLRLLRKDVAEYAADTIILQLCSNDLEDNAAEGLAALDSQGAIVEFPPRGPGLGRRLQDWIDAVPWLADSHLIALGHQLFLPAGDRGPATGSPSGRPDAALTLALLEKAVQMAQAGGRRVLVLSADLDEVELKPFQARLQAIGVPLLAVPCKRLRPDLYFAVDGHWNARGHAEAARRIVEALRH